MPVPIVNETKDPSCKSDISKADDLDCCTDKEEARECCQNACCDDNQEVKLPSRAASSVQDDCNAYKPTTEGDCDWDCCGENNKKKALEDASCCDGFCTLKTTRSGCNKGCCGGEDKELIKGGSVLDDYASKPTESDCNKRCCSKSAPSDEDPKNPSCCNGKPSPCCDVSCLDRIALRECDGTKRRITRIRRSPFKYCSSWLTICRPDQTERKCPVYRIREWKTMRTTHSRHPR